MARTSSRSDRGIAARIGNALLNVVVIAVTLAGVGYIAPSLFGYERYIITGDSMTGTYDKGSIVFEEPVPVETVTVGDVITYLPPPDTGRTGLVTHRIISDTVREDGVRQLQTQGDANPVADPWKFSLVKDTQPVARFSVPYLGWVFITLDDRTTRLTVLGLPAAVIAIFSLAELAQGIRDRRRRRAVEDVTGECADDARELVPTSR